MLESSSAPGKTSAAAADPSTIVDGVVRAEQLAPNLPAGDGSSATLVGTARPRLSWRYRSTDAVWRQDVRELELTRADGSVERSLSSDAEQVLVAWPFTPLESRERVTVRVRGGSGQDWTPWSEPAAIEAGLLSVADWSASWISAASGAGVEDPAPLLGRTFAVGAGLVSARLYLSALGIVVPRINGERVSADHFAPGWTSYEHRLRYQAHDITGLLVDGDNTLCALVGNGWYRGRIASFELHRGRPYGDRLALIAQLELRYDDGRLVRIESGADWASAQSRVLANDLYDGQATDLRLPECPALTGLVDVIPAPAARLVAPEGPPVRETGTLKAVSIARTPGGRLLVDFGQNAVGWVRLRVQGAAGDEIVIRHAEVIEGGELSLRPLRSAKVTDRYLLAGGDVEVLEPELVFHGFRYADIEGIEQLDPADVEAVVIGSDLERTGWFSSSEPALNQLHRNVVWGMRGNFLDVPTDCPQRDERLGWTGDIQVFAPTASALFDVSGFLSSWLADLAADQLADGTVPVVVPRVFKQTLPVAGWGDAAVIVPWVLYQRFGDLGVLARQYDSMRRWVDRVTEVAGPGHLWSDGEQLGDWLDPLAPPDAPGKAQADPEVVATAYYARSCDLLSRAAAALGNTADAAVYDERARDIRTAFVDAYVSDAGVIRSDCQTVYALALHWGLLDEPALRARAADRLAELVAQQHYTMATGFLGTPVILDALSGTGNYEAAYRMLLTRENPSWLFAVDMGATTVWERWDSMLPDGSVNPGEMTSFNHYAFGAVADWMHREIGGLRSTAPGYREVTVAPVPGGGLTAASTGHLSPFGAISVDWAIVDGRFSLEVVVPVGVTARVVLPGGRDVATVTHGIHRFTD